MGGDFHNPSRKVPLFKRQSSKIRFSLVGEMLLAEHGVEASRKAQRGWALGKLAKKGRLPLLAALNSHHLSDMELLQEGTFQMMRELLKVFDMISAVEAIWIEGVFLQRYGSHFNLGRSRGVVGAAPGLFVGKSYGPDSRLISNLL